MKRTVTAWVFERKVLIIGSAIQIACIPFFSHGYDLLVSYVAARNVAQGVGPYTGGELPNPSYPSKVQGIGEAPIWPLYLSLAYIAAGGDLILFNAISKLPVFFANAALYFLFRRLGVQGSEFYLINPAVLLITVLWGKPDAVATLLAVLSLISMDRPTISGILLGVSVNVKPIALGMIPAMLAYLGIERGARFMVTFSSASALIFVMPFVLLGWDLSVPSSGLRNWFKEAGGLNPLNVFELFYGWSYERGYNPYGELVSAPWIAALIAVAGYVALKRPRSRQEMVWAALLGSSAFILARSRVSEQNLILPISLIHLYSGRPIKTRLWVTLLAYSALNYSVPQLLYPIWPTVTIDLHNLTKDFEGTRISIRFVSSVIFYVLYIFGLKEIRNGGTRREG
jgi:hypothetical protein